MEVLFNFILLIVFAAVTWCVASEGPWGAALVFLSVIFSGLLAMNYFELLAMQLDTALPAGYSDIVSLIGLFVGLVFLFRVLTEKISPVEIELPAPVFQGGRWAFAALTGYTTMAFLLTALHTAPLPREFAGFRPERKNFFDAAAPDRQWLGLTQHISEHAMYNSVGNKPRIFDALYYPRPGRPQDPFWATFPIRYATRRDQIAAGGFGGPSNTLAPSGGGAGLAPSSAGGSPKGGF